MHANQKLIPTDLPPLTRERGIRGGEVLIGEGDQKGVRLAHFPVIKGGEAAGMPVIFFLFPYPAYHPESYNKELHKPVRR